MTKAALSTKKILLTRKLKLNLTRKQGNATFGAQHFVVLKPGHFGKLIRNTLKVLKCCTGEGWERSFGSIV